MLWLPTERSNIDEFRVYILDSKGKIPTLESCMLNCSLLFSEFQKSLFNMVSINEWKKHFQSMAHKAFPQEDMYIVNKGSRGLGRNSFARTMYKM